MTPYWRTRSSIADPERRRTSARSICRSRRRLSGLPAGGGRLNTASSRSRSPIGADAGGAASGDLENQADVLQRQRFPAGVRDFKRHDEEPLRGWRHDHTNGDRREAGGQDLLADIPAEHGFADPGADFGQ